MLKGSFSISTLIIILCLVFCFASIQSAIARSAGPPDLTGIVTKADTIVIGRVVEANPSHPMSMSVFVDRVIKGEAKPGSNLKTIVPDGIIEVRKDGSKGIYGVPDRAYGIIFLSKSGKQNYNALTVDNTCRYVLPALPVKKTQGRKIANSEPLRLVVNEALAVFGANAQEVLECNCGENDVNDIYGQVYRAICFVPSEITNPALVAVAKSPSTDPNGKLWAVSCLLRNDDWQFLDSVKGALLNPSANQISGARVLASALSSAIYKHSQAAGSNSSGSARKGLPDFAKITTELLASKDPKVRFEAAFGLRSTNSKTAVSAFANALYDTDEMVRYHAMMGLAEITGIKEKAPSYNNDHLDFWRDWATKNLHPAKNSPALR